MKKNTKVRLGLYLFVFIISVPILMITEYIINGDCYLETSIFVCFISSILFVEATR